MPTSGYDGRAPNTHGGVKRMYDGKQFLVAALAICLAGWAVDAVAQGKVYRWVDEHGVVHYGDAIPPQYSTEQHEVIDRHGARTVIHQENSEPVAPVRSSRDRALLATYGTVDEIEDVRDRRMEFLASQNEVARERLESLHMRHAELADNPAAINELQLVEQRIGEYEAEIERRDGEIERIRAEFASDIARFRELRGLPPSETSAAQR